MPHPRGRCAMGHSPRAALAVLAAAMLCACRHDDQGREQTLGFVTPRSVSDAHALATNFLTRNGYTILDTADRLVRAEKRRPLSSGGGDEIDVLTVTLSTDAEGTRVSIPAITYLLEHGNQRKARQLSADIARDVDALAQQMMVRPT